ncbi:tlde1 domain-containing protein [Enterobacter oligotrophicus]|uniref:tlde1 domain-containing protein n=1 Tax=Enterobacter oligotrophicus TaxID=2478464 RepID=UPI0012611023|nr:tlde1 domain-containing protein [Enterobacter oligotrophicus]
MAKWLYKQSTGELFKNGKLVETGYSGVLTNKNNPDREHVRGMGPIPRGTWKIGSSGTSKGPLTITLKHISGNTYARDMHTFRMHGDKRVGITGFASEGCIIMSHSTRLLVSKDTGALLEVVR